MTEWEEGGGGLRRLLVSLSFIMSSVVKIEILPTIG